MSRECWRSPLIPARRRLRQVDPCVFQNHQGCYTEKCCLEKEHNNNNNKRPKTTDECGCVKHLSTLTSLTLQTRINFVVAPALHGRNGSISSLGPLDNNTHLSSPAKHDVLDTTQSSSKETAPKNCYFSGNCVAQS